MINMPKCHGPVSQCLLHEWSSKCQAINRFGCSHPQNHETERLQIHPWDVYFLSLFSVDMWYDSPQMQMSHDICYSQTLGLDSPFLGAPLSTSWMSIQTPGCVSSNLMETFQHLRSIMATFIIFRTIILPHHPRIKHLRVFLKP